MWLTDITNWLLTQFNAMWEAFKQYMDDRFLLWLKDGANFFATLIELIPVPDFLTQYSLDTLLGNAGPTIAWLVSTFRIGECFAVISAGWVFRLTRKLLTLGQW